MEEQQQVKVHWVGEASAGQDVSIRLVTEHPDPHRRQTVAVVKIHSRVLSTYSKYFHACLSERWALANSRGPVADFALELQADVECYFDCFSSMVSPLLKNFPEIVWGHFKSIEYSLALLQVASRIEFHELMESISRYVACKQWFPEEEIRIRDYSATPGFSCRHAEDLVERLGLDESEEDRHKQIRDAVQQLVRTALEPSCYSQTVYPRAILKHVLLESSKSSSSFNFARMVAMLVIREAKDMLHNLEEECKGSTGWRNIVRFGEKLDAVCWVLDEFLTPRELDGSVGWWCRAQVAGDLLQSFAHAEAVKTGVLGTGHVSKVQQLVLRMYQAVVSGRLQFNTKERLALLVTWHPVLKHWVASDDKSAWDRPTKELFQTLPLKNQMELIQLHPQKCDDYISSGDLLSTLNKACNWEAIKLEDVDASSLANGEAGASKQVGFRNKQ